MSYSLYNIRIFLAKCVFGGRLGVSQKITLLMFYFVVRFIKHHFEKKIRL